MTAKEAADRYKRLAARLGETRAEDALAASFDALALIKNRIQAKGQDYTGSPLSAYTPDYAQRGRLELGYQIGYKDYTRTGQLMKSLRAKVSAERADEVTVELGTDSIPNDKKLQGAVKKDGNLLKLSDREEELTFGAFAERRQVRVRKILNE